MNKNEVLIFHFRRLLRLLRSGEHQQYIELLVKTITSYVLSIGDPELLAQWEILKNYAAIEDFLYNQPKSAEETGVIADLNVHRTATLTYALTFIDNVAKRSPHPEDKEKAKHLDHASEPYKKAAAKNIPTKSADIRNLVQDLKQEPYATYAEDLNLMRSLLILETENNELDAEYVRRAELWLEKEQHGSLTEFHPIEEEALQTVADTLEFLYKVNERGAKDAALRAKFDAIFTGWNAITEQFERVLAQRGTKITIDKPSHNYPTPPPNPEPPSPPVPPPPPDFE
ncbi:hypothetical protein FACS1894181_13050 [Bacteroidia bacterium]|nr:hypothetical protein FACS1894181_13050 [Bacteroidia bacterium]